MTRKVTQMAMSIAVVITTLTTWHSASAASPADTAMATASQNNQFAFVLFYRGNDAATAAMHQTMQSTLTQRNDAVIVPVQIGDRSEQRLVKQFDATRIPLPAVAAIAPNGAVSSVFPRKVTADQLVAAIVSPGQADCLKGLQDGKIVLLCAQPTASADIPMGVRQFLADPSYAGRTAIVKVNANDPSETGFLSQLKVPAQPNATTIAFMAPPGVMVGVFDAEVTATELAQKLAAAGKCCDDENCTHQQAGDKCCEDGTCKHQQASGTPRRRR